MTPPTKLTGMKGIQLTFLLCALVHSVISGCGVTFVLLGSTGSLARLYLWPALFKWHHSSSQNHGTCEMVVFGASRQPFTDREQAWKDLTSSINCTNEESNDTCAENLSRFKQATHFVKIKTQEDYANLQQQIRELYLSNDLREVGRVFYLSIPPSGYQDAVQSIHQYARPDVTAWLRVVLEKPFGSDLASVKHLSNEISKHLREEEIYRVDHYLGKFGVEQILPFRLENSDSLSHLWNKDAIQFVEVAVKEHLDVKGRSKFYDSYGVIRDMLQNHLTEILIRLLVPVRGASSLSPERFVKSKKSILSKLYPPMLKHSLLGQYTGYQRHLQEDGVIAQAVPGNASVSFTPTFASVAMFLRDSRWQGLPLILVSGKQLDQRTAYARVVFKQREFHVGNESLSRSSCLPEIIFLIQNERYPPGVLVSQHLSSLNLKHPDSMETIDSWTEEETTYPERSSSSSCKYTFIRPSRVVEANAYVSVVRAVMEGKEEKFVDTSSLLLSWEVWSPLLGEIELSKPSPHLQMYSPDMLDGLSFELKGTNMLPTRAVSGSMVNVDIPGAMLNVKVTDNNASAIWIELLKCRTVVASKYTLSELVAMDLLKAAHKSIEEKGEFHMAIPGGQSPIVIMNLLSLDYYNVFPWQQTHIWQTDERCVEMMSPHSNWKQISDYLTSIVPVPFHHLHPMPTVLQNGICNTSDNGDLLYYRELSDHVAKDALDYVLLGVGADGHIASLFPRRSTTTMSSSNDFVKIIELPNDSSTVKVKRRMSLSWEAILRARSIGVVVTGSGKKALLELVVDCLKLEEACDLPLVKLIMSALSGRLTLYVDSQLVLP